MLRDKLAYQHYIMDMGVDGQWYPAGKCGDVNEDRGSGTN